jgi:hypothetical protein
VVVQRGPCREVGCVLPQDEELTKMRRMENKETRECYLFGYLFIQADNPYTLMHMQTNSNPQKKEEKNKRSSSHYVAAERASQP